MPYWPRWTPRGRWSTTTSRWSCRRPAPRASRRAPCSPPRQLRHSARATHDRLGGPGQWLLALPVTHVAGLTVLVRSLVARTRPEVLDLYGGFSVDAFVAATARMAPDVRHYTSLVPTQLRRLLDAGADLSSYDGILVGGAALPAALAERAASAGVRVVTTYGMSETCGGCVYDGLPLDGVEVVVRDDGRVELGGPVVFAGYRLRPDLTAAGAGRRPARHAGPRPLGAGRQRAARRARPRRRRGHQRRCQRARRDGRAGAARPPGRRGLRRGRSSRPGLGRAGRRRRAAARLGGRTDRRAAPRPRRGAAGARGAAARGGARRAAAGAGLRQAGQGRDPRAAAGLG